MAIKLIGAKKLPYETGADENLVAKEFLCDTDADFANLPACDPGSSAVSIESGKVYVANTSGEWVEFGGSGGNSSSTVEVTKRFRTIIMDDSGLPQAFADYVMASTNSSMVVSDAGILPTKTTDDVLVSSGTTAMHVYYIEDENDIFMYGDVAGTGVNDWASLAAVSNGVSFGGVITDKTEAIEVGKYYALIEYVAEGPGDNIEAKFRSMAVLEDGVSMELTAVLTATGYIPASDVGILYTKTTDGILATSDRAYFYYIEDENDIFVYGDATNSGTNEWVSVSITLDKMSFGGVITDKTEAIEVGKYYALIEYVGDPEHFGN